MGPFTLVYNNRPIWLNCDDPQTALVRRQDGAFDFGLGCPCGASHRKIILVA